MSKHRVFIAANLPEEIKDSIIELLTCLKKANPFDVIRWVRPESMHLTLHFLSYLEKEKLEKVKELLRNRVGENSSFELKFGQIDAFPNLNRPRVIFIECQEIGDHILADLQKNIGKDLEKLGIEIDKRPWHAHLTLARIKGRCQFKVPSYELQVSRLHIKSIELMESQLKPDRARYRVLESFKLASSL